MKLKINEMIEELMIEQFLRRLKGMKFKSR